MNKKLSLLCGALLATQAQACEIDINKYFSHSQVYANQKGEAFILNQYTSNRYDDMLDVLDFSSCKKISSGVASKSNVSDTLENNGFSSVFSEISSNPKQNVHHSLNAFYILTQDGKNDVLKTERVFISSGDQQKMQDLKKFFAGDFAVIKPDTILGLQDLRPLMTITYREQILDEKNKAKNLGFENFKQWIRQANTLKENMKNLPDYASFIQSIDDKLIVQLLPSINSILDAEKYFYAIEDFKSSKNDGAYTEQAIPLMTFNFLKNMPVIMRNENADKIDYVGLYSSIKKWKAVDARYDFDGLLFNKYFTSSQFKKYIENIEENPEPYLTGTSIFIPSIDAFQVSKKINFNVSVAETDHSYRVSISPPDYNGAVDIAFNLSKKCTDVYGKEYSAKNTESNGDIYQEFYKTKTTTCVLPYGISSRTELEQLLKRFADRNQLKMLNPSYQSVNDFMAQSTEVQQRRVSLGVDYVVRRAYNDQIEADRRAEERRVEQQCAHLYIGKAVKTKGFLGYHGVIIGIGRGEATMKDSYDGSIVEVSCNKLFNR